MSRGTRRPGKLNELQERFCQEYMIDLCASAAYIRAGYSPVGANAGAARLLSKVSVRARVDELMAQKSRRSGISADRVVRELARVAMADTLAAYRAVEAGDDGAEETLAISSIKRKTVRGDKGDSDELEVRMHDKGKALEMLAKHLGILDKIKAQELEIERQRLEIEKLKAERVQKFDDGGIVIRMEGPLEEWSE